MHIQLFISLDFYLLYLLLNSCNRNDATPRRLEATPHSHVEKHAQNVLYDAVICRAYS